MRINTEFNRKIFSGYVIAILLLIMFLPLLSPQVAGFGDHVTGDLQLPLENSPPIANDDFYETYTGTDLIVEVPDGVLANDTDMDDDTLTAELVSGPSHESSFSLFSDGSFGYTPDDDTWSGVDSFTYYAF